MANSASDGHDASNADVAGNVGNVGDIMEARAREIVPSELLPMHEGLEEDGESWRANLPRPENLLRRVSAPPPQSADPDGAQAQPLSSPLHMQTAPGRRAPLHVRIFRSRQKPHCR